MTATPNPADDDAGTALVVFVGKADLGWLRLLKPGFRHCFVALAIDGRWVIVNPLSHQTHIAVYEGLGTDAMTGFYRGQGFTVVRSRARQAAPRAMPWRPFSCVEAVKRVLGIRAPWVLTPWHLYRHLCRDEKKLEKNGKKSLTKDF